MKATPKIAPKARKYYYLITGELVIETAIKNEAGEDDSIVNSIRSNGLLILDQAKISVHEIGKAQQTLQLNFYQKMENQDGVKVVDVVILNIFELGQFTHDEFHKAPEGVKLQQVNVDELLPA